MAARESAVRVAVPAFQRAELYHPARVPRRRLPDAGVGEPGHERAGGAEVQSGYVSHLCGALGDRGHGSGFPAHEWGVECVGREGGVEVLEVGRGRRECEAVVLGWGVAVAGCDGVGDGA